MRRVMCGLATCAVFLTASTAAFGQQSAEGDLHRPPGFKIDRRPNPVVCQPLAAARRGFPTVRVSKALRAYDRTMETFLILPRFGSRRCQLLE